MTASVVPIRQQPTNAGAPRYLSPKQVCELVPGMTVANLKDLRASGKGPAYFKPTGERGHLTLYSEADIIRWVEAKRVKTREQS